VVEQGRRRPQRRSPGAQDPGVPRFQQLGGDVHGHVRAGLVVGADHPHRDPALGEPQPAGQIANRRLLGREGDIGEQFDLAGDVGDPGPVQPEPVEQALAQPGFLSSGDIGGVGVQHVASHPAEQGGHDAQRLVDGAVPRGGQAPRPLPGCLAAGGHRLGYVRHGVILRAPGRAVLARRTAQNRTEAKVAVSVKPTRR
jgi:hypothetical protein